MGITAVQKNAWSFVLDQPTRLLVADDDPILREFAVVHLSSPSAVVETAADGAAALSMLMDDAFDIALVDIAMPNLDGFALLEAIRSKPQLAHLPVMMLTGHEDIASIDRAYELGANAFATKPVNWRQLSYHIRYVLRTSQAERDLRQAHRQSEIEEETFSKRFLAFEVECRTVLRAILRDAAFGGRSAEEAGAGLRRIEDLAAAALQRWDELVGEAAGAPSGAAPAGTPLS